MRTMFISYNDHNGKEYEKNICGYVCYIITLLYTPETTITVNQLYFKK